VPLVRWVGQELALLGEQLAGRHVDSNPVAVEFSETTGIELLWDQPFPDAPAPWEAVPGAWAWRLLYDPDAPVPNPERPALIAGLVTFGRRDGRQFLVNLEALGSMSITGDPEAVANFVRSVAVELGSTDEVADTYIVATPDVAPITVAHHLPRLTIVEPHEALSRLSATASGATRSLEQVGTDSTFAYRIFDPPVIALDVTVVVTSDGDPNLTDRLVENALPHHGVAVLIIGEAHHAAAHLAIDADGQARLEPLGVTFDAVGLPVDTEVAVNGLLDDPAPDTEPFDSPGEATSTAGDSDVWPGPEATVLESLDGEGHPSVIDLTDDPTMTTVVPGESLPELRLLVKVLGAPTIVDGPPLGRRELATVVYVACASKPVRHEHIQDAIWGGEAISSKSVFNLIGATRAALGRWDGEAILTTATRPDSTLRLAEGVWTDLELLRRLVAKAHAVDSSAALPLLVQALELVEGPPFNADGYEWANTDQLVSEAETLIERAALAAADLALDAGNLDLARWAVMQGLRGLPGDEPLYRARMHIEDAAGNPTAIRRAYSELIAYLDDFDAEPSDDTLNLYGQLAPSGRT
jgi:DNA-binding SARP family transcriptional activator